MLSGERDGPTRCGAWNPSDSTARDFSVTLTRPWRAHGSRTIDRWQRSAVWTISSTSQIRHSRHVTNRRSRSSEAAALTGWLPSRRARREQVATAKAALVADDVAAAATKDLAKLDEDNSGDLDSATGTLTDEQMTSIDGEFTGLGKNASLTSRSS
jgi:hypothetical protein